MTRQPHDQFAKQYLEELLSPLGTVETSRDVPSEVRQVDVWFVPASSPSTDSSNLGLLGKMAATACLFEPFRNAPTVAEIHGCLLKLYSLRAELLRKARREKRSVSEDELSCHAFKLGMGSEQDAKPAAWLRLTHYRDFAITNIKV